MDPKDDKKKKKGWSTAAKVATGAAIGAVGTAGGLGYLAKRAIAAENKRLATDAFARRKALIRIAKRGGSDLRSAPASFPRRAASSINPSNIRMSAKAAPINLASLASYSTRIVDLAKKDDEESTARKVGKVAGAAALGGAATTGALYARGRYATPGKDFIPTLNSGASALAGDAKKLGGAAKAGIGAAKAGIASGASQAWNATKKGIAAARKRLKGVAA